MNGMLKNKTVLLCISGGIAAYKMAHVASALKKQHCNVHVIMTENATNFITPITFEELTGNKCVVHTFDRNFQHNVEHVALAKQADVCLIAPATANVIAKLAHGLADDMLTTTVLACRCPKIVAPAMNTAMFENPITQDNIETLQSYGFTVIPPAEGYLACGDVGAGKLPEPDVLLEYIYQEIAFPKDMKGLRVLVTAGPTQEAIDPVRYISNHSTGKMGYAIAKIAARRGAHVTLVTGKTHLQPPMFVDVVPVISADDMFQAVVSRHLEQDIIIKAAAVADYKPTTCYTQKVKKSTEDMTLSLTRTQDILAYLGAHRKEGQFLCGFSMETERMLEYAHGKLERKLIDMIVANNVTEAGAGFGTATNIVTLVTKAEEQALPLQSKEEVAANLLDAIMKART